MAEGAAEMLEGLLRRTHLSAPSDLADIVAEQAAAVGASDVVVYLVDYEQEVLVPLPGREVATGEALSVVGTVAGRAYTSTTILRTPGEGPGRQRLWLPLLDGTERLGVLALSLPGTDLSDVVVEACERFAHLVALSIVTKGAYGDAFEVVRRRKPMTLASELLRALVPPLVFATNDLALAGLLEPCYDNGGDALDYALNGRVLHAGVFDAMGHGLAAAGVSAFALSAYRRSRREGRTLEETYREMDAAVGRQFPESRFVTAVIAELDLDTGRLRWISGGHPAPVVIRGARHARPLEAPAAPPLGVAYSRAAPTVAEESLEPGDLLLFYTDGLTEARGPDGELFTLDRLSEFIEREAAGGHAAPETLRRIREAILGRAHAELRDDATALLVEWRRGAEQAFVPQTVAGPT